MKKVYTKPVLIKLGNLESFVRGMGGSSTFLDIYTKVETCIPVSNHPSVTGVTCGEISVGKPNTCSNDPTSNYFVFSKQGGC